MGDFPTNMKLQPLHRKKQMILLALAGGLVAWSNLTGNLQAANLSAGVEDVGKLVAAKVPDDTILTVIGNSGVNYHLTSDDIVYLSTLGTSQKVLSALLQSKAPSSFAPAPAPDNAAPVVANAPAPEPPPTPAPPPADATAAPSPQIDLPYFQTQLNPYGTWVDLPPYGQVWRPGAAASDPAWRPYCQGGHWVMTDAGWYWQADDPWGAVVFHYGRWLNDPNLGWVWIPGYNWAPSWVAWRHSEGYYGWAPLPPQAEFRVGAGLFFGGAAVGASFDFGLGAASFNFVDYGHIWAHDYGVVVLPAARVDFVFGHSVILNSYHVDHGRFVVEGFGREHIMAHAHVNVEIVSVHTQVRVEHVTVVNNVTNVKNVTIRNNVTNVKNVNNVTNVKNVNNVNNVSNVKNVSNVNNANNVSNVRNVNNVNNTANTANTHNASTATTTPAAHSTATSTPVAHTGSTPSTSAAHPGTSGPGSSTPAAHAGSTGSTAKPKTPVKPGSKTP